MYTTPIMSYIPRILETQLTQSLANRKVLFLLGARQVGKTTLIEHVLTSYQGQLLNMDIEIDRARLRSAAKLAPADVMRSLNAKQVLVIDEAQRVPNIGQIAKGWYDAHVETKIFLLGSSSATLLDMAAAELTGRNEKLWLTPLLFSETITQQSWFDTKRPVADLNNDFKSQIRSLIMPRLVYGSYPEAYLTANPQEYLTNLSSDYLLKDIFTASLIRSAEDVRRLLLEVSVAIGKTLSVAQLASRLQLARPTVERYLQLLESIFVIFSLPAYHTDPLIELTKSRKYYFWDTGVRNALLQEWSMSEQRSDIDTLWENWVLAEILKRNRTSQRHEELYFWRSRNDSAVDLVCKRGSILKPYDIRFDSRGYKPSRSFNKTYNVVPQIITPDNILEILLDEPARS